MSGSVHTSNSSPIVGFVATAKNINALVQNVTKAIEHGCEVVIAIDDSLDKGDVAYLELLVPKQVTLVVDEDGRPPFSILSETASRNESQLLVSYPADSQLDIDEILPGQYQNGVNGKYASSDSTQTLNSQQDLTIAAIPAYNEENTIAEVVSGASLYVDEVIVVDDGSTDATCEVAGAAGATVIKHDYNRGYGGALNSSFVQARERGASKLITLDGDGQHRPGDIPRLLECYERTEAPVIVGSRFVEGGACNAPQYRRFGINVVNVLTNLSMGVIRLESWVTDTQSGFRLYDKRAIESLAADDTIGDAMSASTDILYHANQYGYQIEEAPVFVDYNVNHASSVNPVSHGWTLVSNILKTVERERPMTVLGIPGFVLSLMGIMLGYLAISQFLTSGQVSVGFSMLSILFTLSGLFACLTGIVLHSVNSLLGPQLDVRLRQ